MVRTCEIIVPQLTIIQAYPIKIILDLKFKIRRQGMSASKIISLYLEREMRKIEHD